MRETVNRRRREPSYRPIVLIENATREQWFAVAARKTELPGIIYQHVPTRKYPTRDMAAHLFGYVGEVTEAQLTSAEYQGIEPGAVVGHAGVEKALNKLLMGTDGDEGSHRQQPRPRDRQAAARGSAARRHAACS